METRKKKKRYFYPDAACLNHLSGVWCLFCNITDPDNNNGLTELDFVWNEAKVLRDQDFFTSITCETRSFKPRSKEINSRRTIMCEIYDSDSVDQIIECADKLRERISYKMPMYYKIFMYNRIGKPECKLKYLYTEDRELYEYIEDKWKLLKRV